MRWYQWTLWLMSLLACEAASAQASPRPLDVPATARWQHARSGVILPTRVGEYVRTRIEEYAPNEVDVAAQYDGPAGRLSIYLFRPQTADIGVWFDRAVIALGRSPLFGGVTPLAPQPEAFAPHGGTVASGLRQIFRTSGRFSHTAAALFPTGNWLVKVRLTTSGQDDAAVGAVLDAAIAAVRLPENATAPPPARIIQPCTTARTWRRARAVNASAGDGLAALLGGIAFSAETASPDATDEAALTGLQLPTICRDATALEVGSVYRNPDWDSGYWIAIGDSGTYLSISPDVMGELLGNGRTSRATVTLHSPMETVSLGVFNRLPMPQQALESTGGGGMRISSAYDPEADAAAGAAADAAAAATAPATPGTTPPPQP